MGAENSGDNPGDAWLQISGRELSSAQVAGSRSSDTGRYRIANSRALVEPPERVGSGFRRTAPKHHLLDPIGVDHDAALVIPMAHHADDLDQFLQLAGEAVGKVGVTTWEAISDRFDQLQRRQPPPVISAIPENCGLARKKHARRSYQRRYDFRACGVLLQNARQ